MRLVVASGKGGTGKTMVAVSLALAVVEETSCMLVDADVEEPNVHIFLQPEFEEDYAVTMQRPVFSSQRCRYCGTCAQRCAFNALAVIGQELIFFPELCHGCGGCALFCPQGAVHETDREIGRVAVGRAGQLKVAQGKMQVGEVLSPLVIKQLKQRLPREALAIIDAPPGTACTMVEAVADTDFCLLVTEPTPFGEHDLRSAVAVVRTLGVPAGVVVNRCDVGDERVRTYCHQAGLPILAEFPFSRPLAEGLASGVPAWTALPAWRGKFTQLARAVGLLNSKEGRTPCGK